VSSELEAKNNGKLLKSALRYELLNSLVAEAEQQITLIEVDLETAETKYRTMLASAEALQHEYDQLLTWGDLYRESSFEAKKDDHFTVCKSS
jgi:hypothetical protein